MSAAAVVHSPDAPLRLAAAAALAFPDGSMTASGLRKEASRGRLTIERIAGKDYTTLRAIEEMRQLCRVQPSRSVSGSNPRASTPMARPAIDQHGSSSTEDGRSAQDALRTIVRGPKTPSRGTSRNGASKEAARLWLKAAGGKPVVEAPRYGGRIDVLCERTGTAVECGALSAPRLLDMLTDPRLRRVIVIPFTLELSEASSGMDPVRAVPAIRFKLTRSAQATLDEYERERLERFATAWGNWSDDSAALGSIDPTRSA